MTVQTLSRSVMRADLGIDPKENKTIYWHRELPPSDAESMGEQCADAVSRRVPGTLAHRDELWSQCYEDLMAQAHVRLGQEIDRLGGRYAHVLSESVDSRRDAGSCEAWLHGVFTYMLYR
jgi:hypothetical protein